MSPPRPSTLSPIGDDSGLSSWLATIAAKPSRIITMAPRLRDNRTTMSNTASTKASPIVRIIGNPWAARGVARKMAQTSRTSRIVRLGSLIRSCQASIDRRWLPSMTGWRRCLRTAIENRALEQGAEVRLGTNVTGCDQAGISMGTERIESS